MHDVAMVNNGNISTHVLRFFKVVRGEHNGCALFIDLFKKIPHSTSDFNINASGRFIEDQYAWLVD